MSDEPDNLTLVYLRRIDGKVDTIQSEVRELKHRLGLNELGLAAVRREIATLGETIAHQSVRLDKMEDRLDRIGRRLDLVAV